MPAASRDSAGKLEPPSAAPPLLKDISIFEDALVVACLLITPLENVDRVTIACLAQLVKAIRVRTPPAG